VFCKTTKEKNKLYLKTSQEKSKKTKQKTKKTLDKPGQNLKEKRNTKTRFLPWVIFR